MTRESANYGSWLSPISADLIIKKSVKINQVIVDPITSRTLIIESRPDEGGRNVIVDVSTGRDVFGKEYNARTTVHEYGGAPALAYDGVLYFSNLPDCAIYKLNLSSDADSGPVRVTPDNRNWRYADFVIHPIHRHLLICILEDHTHDEPSQVVNSLVVVNVNTSTVSTLVEGADFYAEPRVSPNGKRIAFIRWYHPDMPWDGGELLVQNLVATPDAISLQLEGESVLAAGKRGDHSAQQPTWIDNDTFLFISDQTGFLNPYIFSVPTSTTRGVLGSPVEYDYGESWHMGQSSYSLLNASRGVFVTVRDGRNELHLVNLDDGVIKHLPTPYVQMTSLYKTSQDTVVLQGKKIDEAATLVEYNLSSATFKVLTITSSEVASLPDGILSQPRPLSLAIPSSEDSVYVIYYPPTNPKYVAPEGELPPCIVSAHGGPTARASMGLDLSIQYFTSRGWAWVDVNYGGSTGYGASYINRLKGKWGIVDVEDCAVAVDALSEKGLIDQSRVAIRGGSAGGFTVLASVTSKPQLYAAGTSLFGICDLVLLAEFTHKFESHYLEGLMGGPIDEIPEVYRERSPITHANKIRTPLLILQGSDDKVVPPNQAKTIVKAIKGNKGVVRYIEFPGEGHGWRQAKHIKESLEAELKWYQEVLNLKIV